MSARDKYGKPAGYSFTGIHADYLSVKIYETREMMSLAAAAIVAEKIKMLLTEKEFVNIIFASAPSQSDFLIALTKVATIDWGRLNVFHMDEYIGLPENDPRSFAWYLDDKIFGRRNFHFINYINGNAPNIGEECKRYSKLLAEYPPDIVCLGIGENGHLAFNDPHVADFNDPARVKMVKLDPESRQQQVNDGCFADMANVPAYAITLTIPALMAGRYIYGIVPGPQKSRAVFNTIKKEMIEDYPSTILRKHENAVLFLDSESSSLL